jgi:hypothetical protein
MDMRLHRPHLTRRRKAAVKRVRLDVKAERATVYVARDGRGRVIGAR